jgi:hypothetical protein
MLNILIYPHYSHSSQQWTLIDLLKDIYQLDLMYNFIKFDKIFLFLIKFIYHQKLIEENWS